MEKEAINSLEDKGEATTALRSLPETWKLVVYIIGVAASIFHIWVNTIGVMPGFYRNAVHFGFIMVLSFSLYPMLKRRPQRGFGLDIFFVLLACAAALYILLFEEELYLDRGSVPIMRDYIFAAIAVVILLMGTYRAAGPIIPGSFHYRGVALGRLLYRMYLTDEGMFGIVCTVSSTYVYLFIPFGAFIMAQWTGISYLKIIGVAAIPAVMYFLSVGFFVHIEALKLGMKPMSKEEIPNLKEVLKEGTNFLIPAVLLVLLLVRGFTPTYAACIGILSIVVVSWLRKETRMGLKDVLEALYVIPFLFGYTPLLFEDLTLRLSLQQSQP